MRVLIKTALVLLGLATLLVGISFNILRAQDLGPRDKSTRTMGTEPRTLTAEVQIIKMEGAINLRLKQGPVPAIVIYAEQRFFPNISTVQEGSTLRISTRGLMINAHKPMHIELTLPNLQQLQISGSGDAVVSGFSGEAVQLALQGSGDLQFDGKYKRVSATLSGSGDLRLGAGDSDTVEIALQGSGDANVRGSAKVVTAKLMGSGDLRARDLIGDSVEVKVMGSGDADVFAKQSVNIDMMGSGDVRVTGKPTQRVITKRGSGDANFD